MRPWLLGWLGGSVLGVINGIVREATYKRWVGDRAANDISVATLILMLGGNFFALQRRWPIPGKRQAAEIGAIWVALTVLFEFGFGHWGDHKSWDELLDNYNLAEGHLWPLVLVWIAIGPTVTRTVAARRLPGLASRLGPCGSLRDHDAGAPAGSATAPRRTNVVDR
jgi:hypothetical protein